jgi:hypothetical protein
MPCHLTFGAKDINPDAVAATLKIKPDHIFRAGDRDGRQKYSGLAFDTSEADFEELDQQIADTITFLRTNEEDLRYLGSLRSTIEDSWYHVDFGFNTRMFDENVGIQIDTFPAELLQLLGSISADLMLSQYPPTFDAEAENGSED